MDKNKHKLYMAQILSLIFKDKDLCNVIAFKGGTSLMFFRLYRYCPWIAHTKTIYRFMNWRKVNATAPTLRLTRDSSAII